MAKFDKVIPPGQEGRITLVVQGNKVHGAFSKSATVHSNDPESPRITLTLAGTEKSYVEVTPPNRLYLQGQYGEEVAKTVVLRSNEEGLDFKVTGVSSNIDDKITYRYEQGTDGEYTVHIYKNPRLPTVNTFGTLFVHTNSEHVPEKEVQIQVVTKGSITAQPSVVNFGRVRFGSGSGDGQKLTRSFTVLKMRGEFGIEKIEVDNDNYTWNVEEAVPGQRYKINVTFKAPDRTTPRQNEFGEMTVYTTDPKEPMVRVRLIARSE